jgi:hypothetical protein
MTYPLPNRSVPDFPPVLLRAIEAFRWRVFLQRSVWPRSLLDPAEQVNAASPIPCDDVLTDP